MWRGKESALKRRKSSWLKMHSLKLGTGCKWTAAIYSLLVLFPGCDFEKQPVVFPGDQWEMRTPESQGVDAGDLSAALDYLESKCLDNGINQVTVIRNGYMIHAGEQIDSVHNIWSCSKTFTSTVLGLLVDDGILSLDDRAADYEPLLKEKYPDVTFRHFATMTSGYSGAGVSRWNEENADWSWTPYQPDEPYFEPGTQFAYWDEAQMMFGRVLTRILNEEMRSFLQRRVTDTIGMGEWQWHPEGELNGIPINNGCTNVHVNARQLARWGWLFLNRGNWNGEQLVSEQWVDMATTVQVPFLIPVASTDRDNIRGSGCYGFNWWINGRDFKGELKLEAAPEGIFWASGHNNNKCFVVPQWNLVFVRMGEDGHPPDADRVWSEFFERLARAIIA